MGLAGYMIVWLACYIATLATSARMQWKTVFNFMLALGFLPIGVVILELLFGTTGWFGAIIVFTVSLVSIGIAVPVVIAGVYETTKQNAGMPNDVRE
jgi:ABC-type nickel/cobalt efflux system permease component RcnA